MSNKFSNIKERILQVLEIKGIVKDKFFNEIGMTYGNFTGKAKETPLNSNAISNILSKIKDLNPMWLLTGEGEMLLAQAGPVPAPTGGDFYPVVDVAAFGGFGSADFRIDQSNVIDYCSSPNFKGKKIDFVIPVNGYSMAPKYKSGDLVACSIVSENTFIQWNEVYVLATREQGILLKRIRKGKLEGCLLAVSDNPEYDPIDIPEKEITGLAFVVGGFVLQ